MISELEFKSLSAQGYNRIPLMAEAFADLETPLSLYLKLAYSKDSGKYSFLLESVVGGERFGRYSFIGGCSRVAKDVPPYVKAVGNPVKLYGLNTVGLQRNGFPEDVLRELKRAYRLFFKSELNVSQARARAESDLKPIPEVQEFLRFFERSDRGVVI